MRRSFVKPVITIASDGDTGVNRHLTLPLMVLGKSGTNTICRGYLYGAVTRLQWA